MYRHIKHHRDLEHIEHEIEGHRIVGHKLEQPEHEEIIEQGHLYLKKVHYPKLSVRKVL